MVLTLWDMVSQFMEKEDMNMVDVMAERALKNEIKDEKDVGISLTLVVGGELNQLKSVGSHSPLELAFGV